HPTEQRPLSWQDQQRLRDAIFWYNEFRNHPLFSYKGPPELLELAFSKEGWDKPSAAAFADLTPGDVAVALRRAKRALQRFAITHRALRRVREQCRLYQQKWQTSGPLAMLDSAGLDEALAALVGRHLVVREANGSVSVHPA